MKTTCTCTLLAALFALATAPVLHARTWTEAESGRTLEGDFVKLDGENAVIRRADGNSVSVALAKLSDTDREFIQSQSTPDPAGDNTELVTGNEAVLSGVHLCCGGCEKGIAKALAEFEDVEFDVSRSEKTVTLSSSSPRKMQEAVDAIADAGYYGTSNHEAVKIKEVEAGTGKGDSVEVSGVHLCCGKCIDAVDSAIENIEGAATHNAEKNSPTFTIEGEGITAAAVIAALHAEGINGTVR